MKGEPEPTGTGYNCGFLYIVDVIKSDGSDFHCVRKTIICGRYWFRWEYSGLFRSLSSVEELKAPVMNKRCLVASAIHEP